MLMFLDVKLYNKPQPPELNKYDSDSGQRSLPVKEA